jgi:8-oxo-dGTP pyrophosphatase MutT (NUDIX family)
MYRKKNNHIYYTYPGGTVEKDETPEIAAQREIFEETSIRVAVEKLLYQVDIYSKASAKREYFYLCTYIDGTPQLLPNSIESMRLSEKNFYKPLWIPLEKLPQLKLYPFEIRDRFILDLAKKLLP